MAILPNQAGLDGALLAGLMQRVAEHGDRAAFARLFGLLAPRLKGHLLRLGAEDGVAEELVQDVMLTVWRRAAEFDASRAGVTTWVYAIARNRRIDRLRREQRPELDPADPLLAPGPSDSAEAGIEIAEQEHRLRLAIERLPREQADLLIMAYFEDKAHTGIAAERNLPLGTVKSRLRLALQHLRRALAEDLPR